ncbi:MAG: PAS domain-containing protein [Burkholderiaceae bacterium]|nr:PAS domain-containing protein [Rhodoferax sp.]MCP5283718.1 PAS domain-containing protein [Burkholderiaceae bacterium]
MTPSPETAAWLNDLPLAVLALADNSRVQWANTTAARWLGDAARPGAAWPDHLRPAQAGQAPVELGTGRRVQVLDLGPVDGGRRIALEAVTPPPTARTYLPAAREREQAASQLALAADLAGLITVRHDLRRDRYHFNPAGAQLLGLPPHPEGVPTARVAAHMHPDDREAARAASAQALQDRQPVDAELRVADHQGRYRRLLMRGVVETDDHGAPVAILSVALDITRQRDQTARTRDLMARFDIAARTAGIGYWAYEGHAPLAFWSDQMRSLHGLAPGEAVPTLKSWRETFVHPDDRAAVRRGFDAWLAGHTSSVQSELRIVRRDGSVRHLLTHSMRETGGDVPVLFGIAVDITERRQADEALRRADERAALAARGAGIGTWELDLRNGVAHWDAQMWHLRGRPPQSATPTGPEMLAFVHPEDQPATRRHVAAASTAEAVLEYAFRVVWPDGSIRWLASRSATVLDDAGVAVRRIGVNWDVTADRRAEAERRNREAAEQANAEKSRFLARMSHELRTPLNAVIGFTQLLLARNPDATARDWLGHVEHAGQHLLSLINDVLDLSSLEAGDLRLTMAEVDLPTLLTETLPLLDPMRAGHGVTLDLDLPPLRLWSDATRLRQVLINLVGNAIKYNRRGGQVRLRGHTEGGLAVLAISDTGRGMDAQQLQHLYEPFNRLGVERDGIEGTGIGLTIVKALVSRLGGSLQVRSVVGEGSCFTLRLPLALPPVAPSGPGESQAAKR